MMESTEQYVPALGHLGEVQGKIADLKKLEEVLAGMVSECSGGTVPDCPVIDALFRGST